MKTSIEFINEYYYFVTNIVKDRGDNGYYVVHGYMKVQYDYISKHYIAKCLTRGEYNVRKKKLMIIKIMSE